ncbi:TolC family protein [Alphaproteobacteria bacterium]|nr:TolC family protein [Alphaproteobacteria bacterium]
MVYTKQLISYLFLTGALIFSSVDSVSASPKLEVSDLILAALDNDPSLRVASARQDAAQMAQRSAKSQFWPTPSLGWQRIQEGEDPSVNGDRSVAVIKLEQPLWTGGRLTSNLERARSEVGLAEAETREAEHLLANRIIKARSESLVASRKLNAQSDSLARHERLLKMVERRLKEGASAQADVALARSRIELVSAEIMLLKAQRASALDRLRLFTGLNLQIEDLSLEFIRVNELEKDLASLIRMSEAISPQISKAQSALEVARADVGAARARIMPQLSVRYEHQEGNFTDASVGNEDRVYLSFNTELGAGLSNLSDVGAANARSAAAQQGIALQKRILAEQVQSNLVIARAANIRLRGLKSASIASSEVLDSYERQFLAGRKQWLDLMNAAREQAQSEAQLADAEGALELSSLKLKLFSGGVESLLNTQTLSMPERTSE